MIHAPNADAPRLAGVIEALQRYGVRASIGTLPGIVCVDACWASQGTR